MNRRTEPRRPTLARRPKQAAFNAVDGGRHSRRWLAATNSVGPSGVVGFSDPLNINNPGPFDSVPLDNITIRSNLNPQGQGGPNPRGPNALVLVNSPAFGLDNTAILSNTFVDSFDILSGPPAGDNHTAMGTDVISLAPSGGPRYPH